MTRAQTRCALIVLFIVAHLFVTTWLMWHTHLSLSQSDREFGKRLAYQEKSLEELRTKTKALNRWLRVVESTVKQDFSLIGARLTEMEG
jgi:hypothetical protein